MKLCDFTKLELGRRRKLCWKVLRKVMVCLFLVFALSQFLSFQMASVRSQSSSLLVFAEASSFARLDDIDPSGWFFQAVLYNPTDSDIVVTGLIWGYNATARILDGSRDVKCYDSRYFSSLPVTNMPNDKSIWWEYPLGSISIAVPAKEIIVTWIEVPPNSKNDDAILATYYVQAYVNGQWLSSPLYVSHSGHDKIASTVFRADFNLTTDPNDEQQNITQHIIENPEWLFNEDRSVIANLSTRARVIPVTTSRNTLGIDYATINVTLPPGWSYVPGSEYNPYNETITPYSVDGKDRLEWNLDNDVLRYSTNQSMAQNYIEFNVTAPYVPGIHNFTIASTITSLVELRTTIENQYIYAVVKTPPNATFMYSPAIPLTSENVTFNATASYDLDGQIVNYFWDFGDGNTDTGNITTHSYADNGTYTVTLTITDNDGLNDTTLDTIIVQNRPPIAQFTESAETVDTDVVIYFNASVSSDPDGSIVTYFWDFGDSTNATGVVVNHTYTDDGVYTVTLTVTDDDGTTASTNATKTVLNRSPVAIFTESAETVYTDEAIYFNASNSYDPDGTIVSYFWDFGDGTNTTGMLVNHTYIDNSNYTVTLTVTDNDGATASANATKTVLNRSPVASFTESATTVYTEEIIYFNASESYDQDGYIVTYFWDFGDGTNATGMTTSHTYIEDGNYIVKLTVTDDDRAQVIATIILTILNRAPIASFVIVTQQLTTNDTIIFDATDSYDPDGTIVNYTWDFGDGNITTTSNSVITHIYHEPRDFNVTLTLIDNDNYSDSTSQIINVHVHDVAIINVIVSPTDVQTGQVINITVTTKNKGTTTESFNVTLFYNETMIENQLVSNLAPDAENILNFYWNTTGVTPDIDYTIKAEVTTVPGETDIVDNTYTYGIVEVKSQDPPPFDWTPILPYLVPTGATIVSFLVALIFKKELLGLLLGAILSRLGFSAFKKRKKRRGFGFFDEMTDGGIPDSFSVLISGEPGSGKSVLCQQLTHTFLAKGDSCLYITYDCFPDEIRENMEKFHWNVPKYESEGKLVFIDSFSSIANVTSKEKYSVSQPFSLSDLGITISQATNEEAHVPRVFLDSIVPLFTHVGSPQVVEFLQDRSARIKGVKGTSVFTIGKETIEPNLRSRLEEIVDCVIELEVSHGNTRRRMRIKKMRGRKTSVKWIQFDIDPKKGIVFIV